MQLLGKEAAELMAVRAVQAVAVSVGLATVESDLVEKAWRCFLMVVMGAAGIPVAIWWMTTATVAGKGGGDQAHDCRQRSEIGELTDRTWRQVIGSWWMWRWWW